MEADKYRPRYQWRLTWPVERDDDFAGYDGEQYIGRIYQTHHDPIKGKWNWNASYPKGFRGTPPLPIGGFVDTAREASRKVEEYWDDAKAKARV